MKNLLVLILISFVSVAAHAQEIPAKANTITITLPDSNNVKEKVLKVLTSKGYEIKDKNAASISTNPKTIKNTRVILYAQIKGADVILTGRITIAAQGSHPVEYKGNKGTPSMIAWEDMDNVAKAFKGKVKYEVK